MGFESRMLIESDGKRPIFVNGELVIKSANKITLYLTGATDYKNDYPNYNGRDYKGLNKNTIASIKQKDYGSLLSEHIADYTNLFSRVDFVLKSVDQSHIPTDDNVLSMSEDVVL